jgi:hypothetical protein
MKLPYERFIRFCISQGKTIQEIQDMFSGRSPFMCPNKLTLQRIYLEFLEDYQAITQSKVTVDSKKLAKITPETVPTNRTPILLNPAPEKKKVAEELGVKEFWSIVVDDKEISGIPMEQLTVYKRAYEIFERMTKPKRDICLLSLAEYNKDRIQELVANQYDTSISKAAIDIFLKYFWDIENCSWSDMEVYIEEYIDQGQVSKRESRLLRWALDKDIEKLAYTMGFQMKSLDEMEVVQKVVFGELINLDQHYQGEEEINAYERNKMTSNMRQVVLWAKGYRELLGVDSPEDIQDELINPEQMNLEGHREEDDFSEENLKQPDTEDIKEDREGEIDEEFGE